MAKYSNLFRNTTNTDGINEPMGDVSVSSGQPGGVEKFTILFVDDEDGVLSAMRRIFMEENYNILTASNGEKALSMFDAEPIHLVVSDHRMPGMTGAELLKAIKELSPQTIRIMLTGHADVNSIMGAVKDGAVYKFITKPWNDEDLRLTVSLALQQYTLIQENKRLKDLARTQQLKLKNYSSLFDENHGMMGSILVRSGVIKQEELENALENMEKGEFLSEAIVRLRYTSEAKIIKALQENLNIEYVDLREYEVNQTAARFLPRDLCERNRIIPIKMDGRQLTMAMADPSDIYKIDNIATMTGLKVTALLSASTEIVALLKRIYGENNIDDIDECIDIEPLDEIDIVIEEDEKDVSIQELVGSSEVPPVIRIVNAVISEAIRFRASDIHVEAKTKYTLIRFRIDGLLHSKIKIPADLHAAIISRLKILAKMDISERRKPQDGRITVKAGTRIVDMRVSSLPTLNGEKIVMRILDKSSAIRSLDELGVLQDDLKKISMIVRKPQGVIVTTGPTGSGKTTMLYSILAAMLESSKNFETIEEPVEYFLEDANQVAVRDKIGLTFAQVLRATLRQDPDVILVGEIRDHETADVAFKASLTGHMVLSTLHTNSSVASITRLIDMGVKPYIIGSALEGIIAQRLVRQICPHCKTTVSPDPDILDLLRVPPDLFADGVSKGMGCDQCNKTGYMSRTGIYEVFVMNEDFRHMISTGYRETELFEMARAAGMRTLVEDGLEKVRLGLTTLEELLRVIGPQLVYERCCDNCHRNFDAKFLFCPYCGSFRQNFCKTCKISLETSWLNCPNCGSPKDVL
ncbi:response receiver type II secretion system ATPase and double zinc ribbon protein, PulE and DZR domain-containing [Geotalea daltonii FRC-32]|uniref:Response receiver type II secretion system ATPase and double zinc ribbon protein, PulE and DZR domain-containing n=1 Tax=Geotalea daltonii (strain DSM 22248 / JCM 15807 / FRC-32) TaxID=316067 RepID=B9M659_GEODF|nr:ATPase, T2SS/T4P/T4SS family [Geotalea daltonii]ACM21847.1 response receiver type II secretion system ATPase and double zinc ribbon protein, PulE and DZR domain-containing [Geotalea daltonii FRC-32]